MKLTEDERETLRAQVRECDELALANLHSDWAVQSVAATFEAAVEAILTARLTRVEVLADEPVIPYPAECQCAHGMGFQFHQYPCRYADNIPKASIRAALAAAPSREGES